MLKGMLDVLMKAAGYCAAGDDKVPKPKVKKPGAPEPLLKKGPDNSPKDYNSNSETTKGKTEKRSSLNDSLAQPKPTEISNLLFSRKSYPKAIHETQDPHTKRPHSPIREIKGNLDKSRNGRRKNAGLGFSKNRLQQGVRQVLKQTPADGCVIVSVSNQKSTSPS